MSPGSAFLQFWWTERTRDTFLSYVPKEELALLRLACHDFSVRAAPRLFEDVSIKFRASTFTKPARMAALNRVGQHVQTLTFEMAHTPETFLPPLLNPITGEEETFIYEPHISSTRGSASRFSVPTYGSWEMTDMLVKQYSPLFHSAANVPSFIRAFSAMPNLTHLKVSCPAQESSQRYRRSIIDYALISLRIAVERSELAALDSLSLYVHPAATLYLSPISSYGVSVSSPKRWKQIRNLVIHMDTIPFHPGAPTDHFKLLHAYLHVFASNLRTLHFRWIGLQGPCPLSLASEPRIRQHSTSPVISCPQHSSSPLRPLRFARLRDMEADNVAPDAAQVAAFITAHRRTLREFNYERTRLRSGSWDDALAPLTRISGSESWKEKSEEVMDVPLVLSPVGLEVQYGDRRAAQDHARRRASRFGGVSAEAGRGSAAGPGGWHKAGAKGKELLWGTPEHMRRFLRMSMFSWL